MYSGLRFGVHKRDVRFFQARAAAGGAVQTGQESVAYLQGRLQTQTQVDIVNCSHWHDMLH